ncbi:TPA: DUF551 domain-containing protein [Klebsiella pneumoniae]|nr:DUF551 domain-containing protein [Klebsiella pneumoniae]HBY8320270.1 DUF551 domain-containing protein [Klebsiella pneumoniae]
MAAFRLAAMDSEPFELPLDYLQGHKDGLEWAAQLAEANHPETGDWLYDDPIELAKAIRKGPDMPPSQPALDTEPVALQPELAKVIYHFRDWNEGFPVERFKADYVISWMLANYPPAPVVPGWIPVSERLPNENAEQQILACFKGGDISALYYSDGRWDDAYGIVPIRQDVTHWMPLPAAPQEVK